MAVFPLTFGQLAEVMEWVHAISPSKQAAFRSRLKHLQRLGFPPGVNTGKGQRAEYGIPEVLLIALAVELLQLGLTPERASGVLGARRDVVVRELKRAFSKLGTPFAKKSVFMYLDPRGLIDLQDEELFKLKCGIGYESLFIGTDADLAGYFKRRPDAPARLAVLDLVRVVSDIATYIEPAEAGAKSDVVNELVQWGLT